MGWEEVECKWLPAPGLEFGQAPQMWLQRLCMNHLSGDQAFKESIGVRVT